MAQISKDDYTDSSLFSLHFNRCNRFIIRVIRDFSTFPKSQFEMPVGLRLGEEKGIKTEVREVNEISKKNRNDVNEQV